MWHPDLVNNIWSNKKEIPGNGIDDDNNGFTDDINGWNFVDNSPSVIPSKHGLMLQALLVQKGTIILASLASRGTLI